MRNLIVWGAGKRASKFFSEKYFEHCRVTAVIDTHKKEDFFRGIPVYTPEQLPDLLETADYLLAAIQNVWEIHQECVKLGIDLKKVLFPDNIKVPAFYDNMDVIKEHLPRLYLDMQKEPWALVKLNEKDYFDKNKLIGTLELNDSEYCSDYFRYRTFELIADELIAADVKGAVAELGVFRGTFSRLINKKFAVKRMYLFDTFEGFDSEEAEKELLLGRCAESFIEGHKDTSAEIAVRNLLVPEQCVICKGLFPESVTEEAEKETYCFVSIDVDFEDSIYSGIDFFYPRLAEGGILYIHDYNTYILQGVRAALKHYEEIQGIRLKKIPLADRAGTVVIIK